MIQKITITFFLWLIAFKAFPQFVYLNPLPGSNNHHPEVTIALNAGSDVEEKSLHQPGLFSITGRESGNHSFKTILSTDHHTVILKPSVPFTYGETVVVIIREGIATADQRRLKDTAFSFSIMKELTAVQVTDLEKFPCTDGNEKSVNTLTGSSAKLTNFPTFTVTANNNPASGSFFFCNKNDVVFSPSYLTIMNNDASFYYSAENDDKPNDWKLNDNCTFTYFDQIKLTWFVLDTAFAVIDSFRCGNGLEDFTDAHEFRMYPGGYAYVEADDEKIVDMSQYIPGGDPAAVVKGFTLQKMDANHNVIFEWRSWDHFQITDAAATISLTAHFIDPVHGNSIDEDADGNLLLSFRNMCEITKIDGVNGDIIWRWGGDNNMFTVMNDFTTPSFYYQHYVRRLSNGHILLFNNNNYQNPQQSAAKEYAIDEPNHIAALVWSYVHPYVNGNPVFGRVGGSAQRLSNGHTVICWGQVSDYTGSPNFTEVDSLGNIAYEFAFEDSNQYIYRATKHIWQTCDQSEIPTEVNDPLISVLEINPNPSSGNFNLNIDGFMDDLITISLQNTLGEKVYTERTIVHDARSIVKVSLPSLPGGLYIVNVEGSHQQLQAKLILQ